MIVLDTNVLSALMRQIPEPAVVGWLDRQPRMSIWTSSVSVFEVRYGLRIMPEGKRRSLLIENFEAFLEKIGHRVAPFDAAAALQSSELMATRHKQGRPGEWRDTMIAGIVLSHHASLATRNTTHFADLSSHIINPWAG